MIPPEIVKELVELREEVEILREQLREKEERAGPLIVALMDAYGLTAVEAKVLRALSNGATWTRDMIMDAIGDELEQRSIDSHIKRIRKKVPPGSGVVIESVWGVGYRLTEEAAKVVRLVMAGKIKLPRRRKYFTGSRARCRSFVETATSP